MVRVRRYGEEQTKGKRVGRGKEGRQGNDWQCDISILRRLRDWYAMRNVVLGYRFLSCQLSRPMNALACHGI